MFNCGEDVTAFQIPTSFPGIAQAHTRSSFDKLPCVNVEVLSVIVEQFSCTHFRCARA
jgi:hypothetical protein